MRNQQHFNRNYYQGNGNNGHLLGGGGGGLRIVPATAHQSGSEPTVLGGGLHYDTMASSASKPYQTLEMVDYVTAAEVDNNQNGEQFIFSVQLLLRRYALMQLTLWPRPPPHKEPPLNTFCHHIEWVIFLRISWVFAKDRIVI